MNEMSSDSGPSMKMYFHGGINDYMMFQSWVPKTLNSYLGAWFLFFFLAVGLEAFLVFGGNYQNKIKQGLQSAEIDESFGLTSSRKDSKWYQARNDLTFTQTSIISILRLLESTLAYFLMLVTMIFNTGLFFSVVAGHAVGVFFFARFKNKADTIKMDSDPTHTGLSSPTPQVQDEFNPEPICDEPAAKQSSEYDTSKKGDCH